jgi:hypothetical protein
MKEATSRSLASLNFEKVKPPPIHGDPEAITLRRNDYEQLVADLHKMQQQLLDVANQVENFPRT